MYATTTRNHTPMPEDLGTIVRPEELGRTVGCHFENFFLSLTPDEATRFALALIEAAAQARVMASAEAAVEAEAGDDDLDEAEINQLVHEAMPNLAHDPRVTEDEFRAMTVAETTERNIQSVTELPSPDDIAAIHYQLDHPELLGYATISDAYEGYADRCGPGGPVKRLAELRDEIHAQGLRYQEITQDFFDGLNPEEWFASA